LYGAPVIVGIEHALDGAEYLCVEVMEHDTATASSPVYHACQHPDLLPYLPGHEGKFHFYERADRQNHNTRLDEQSFQADIPGSALNYGMAFVRHAHLERNRLA
jgi:hypothetical protein